MSSSPTIPSVLVRVSARSMRQRFNGCEPDYIRDVCKGACCRASDGTIHVAVAPIEVKALVARGATVLDGFIQPAPGAHRCPFQHPVTNLCSLHDTPDKPFGCIASPFILTSRGTLVVRNRYRLLRCYEDGRRLPAYRAFASSLRLLFGPGWADHLTRHLDAGRGDITLPMPLASYTMLGELAGIRAAE